MAPFIFNVLFLMAAIVLAHVVAWRVGKWSAGAGEKSGILSEVTERSSHERPTSRLGGLALAAGFFLPYMLLVFGILELPRSEMGWGGNPEVIGWILAGAGIIFIVGLGDDLWDLPPPVKLLGQLAAAATILPANLRFLDLEFIPVPGIAPDVVLKILSVIWILFFVNAFNFMDGMDGFAARFTMSVCFWLFGTIALRGILGDGGSELLDLRVESFMLPVLGSAAAGFYRVNRPPARVFMGDAGSHLLGFLLAIQVFLGDGEYYIARPVIPLFGPTLSAGAIWICYLPFIFDVTITLLRRARLGENLISPHRSHLYQRLMITGMSHREVLLLNIRYFRICGALGLTFAVLPWLTRELLRVSFPWVVGRVVLGGAAFLVMVYYWLTVLKKERAGGRAAPAGAK